MIKATCPICKKTYEVASIADRPSFPFCSDRCRLIDLGRWIDGDYALPVTSQDPASLAEEDADEED